MLRDFLKIINYEVKVRSIAEQIDQGRRIGR